MPAPRASHPYRPPRRFRACRSGLPPRSLPWTPLTPPAVSQQAGLGVSAPARADDAARLHLHQPVKVMATVRAAVGPTSVQDPQHPLCLACGRPHRAATFIPLPVRRSSQPRRSTFSRSRFLLDLGILRSFHPSLLQRRRSSGKATGPSRPDRDMKATPRRNVNGVGGCFSALSHASLRRCEQEPNSRQPRLRKPSLGRASVSGPPEAPASVCKRLNYTTVAATLAPPRRRLSARSRS